MLLWAEILRSIPLPTVSLFPENKDIANGSIYNYIDLLMGICYKERHDSVSEQTEGNLLIAK
jgi:hypothetical protein